MTECNVGHLKAIHDTKEYPYPLIRSYEPGSASMVEFKGTYYLNTRYVNYWYTSDGNFAVNDVIGNFKSKNVASVLDEQLRPVDYHEMNESTIGFENKWSRCYGLEDVRLFVYRDTLYYLATNVNYTKDSVNSMVMGEYDPLKLEYRNSHFLHSPYKRSMQKNWIPLVQGDELWFIYRWFPMEIGQLDETHTLVIHKQFSIVDAAFRDIRGSTGFVEYGEYLVGMVHYSVDGTPRKYFHKFVALDKHSLEPKMYTDDFCFRKIGVEFCLSLAFVKGEYVCWISQMDRDPLMLKLDMEKINFVHRFQS